MAESSTASSDPDPTAPDGTAADALGPLVRGLIGDDLPVRFVLWDGSTLGPRSAGTIVIHSPDALRRVIWAPGELGVGRAYVAGDLDIEGDIFAVLEPLSQRLSLNLRFAAALAPRALATGRRLGLLGRPPPPPPEEAEVGGWRHSRRRDAAAITHHYDVGNDFYRLVLGPSMTYSCARYTSATATLEEAQAAKHELVCRKLGLHERPGARLLDVGCGWGSLAIHAARHHGARVVGVTISDAQVDLARRRVADAGLADRVEIRPQDYRDVTGPPFDAIASVGMFEHVGSSRIGTYFETLAGLLADGGRLLNHAISSPGGSTVDSRTFMGRYVFPDGELLDVGEVVLALGRVGLEVRDVESLREHYGRTTRAWVANLESRWAEAVTAVGAARARIWRLYMAGSAVGFGDGGLNVHQVLAVRAADGRSGMPLTRRGWE